MAWNGTKVWTASPLTSADMNTYMSENLDALKTPPSGQTILSTGNVTSTSTSWENIGAGSPVYTQTITTTGGNVLVSFHGNFRNTGGIVFLNFTIDGTPHVDATLDGVIAMDCNIAVPGQALSFVRFVTGLSAGAHVFVMRWKVSAGTVTHYAGATANAQLRPQFTVVEIG